MSKALKPSPAPQQEDVKFELACPSCTKNREFQSKSAMLQAERKGTSCFSCRTVANNKNRKGTKAGDKNPAWKGYKDIPGKVLSKLKRDADSRGIEFHITLEDIQNKYEQQNKCCALSGIPVVWGLNASVDRIDSNKHYTVNNIQIVVNTVNIMKRDIPEDVFVFLCKQIAGKHK
jgi:hypothetical protein